MQDHLKQKEWVTMDKIQISLMNIQDISDVLLLEKSHDIHILNSDILISDLSKDNYYYIVAKIDNIIVGYAGISYILDSADLISIVVEKSQTKKGIASSLLSNIYSFCINNGIIKILLEVRKSNIIAQSLYEKQGFKKISERKKYYDNIEDAYIYEKEL